jgi:Icc-related predicted phosphoesterase
VTVLLHISDTHGELKPLDLSGVTAIVHSGDFFPNATRGNRFIEPAFQQRWVETNSERLRAWTGGAPLLFIPGNHDFLEDAQGVLRDFGIDATDLTGQVLRAHGLRFYGFPWVNRMDGEWNYEASDEEMALRFAEVPDDIDVLVSHGPIDDVLDVNAEGQRCGSVALREGLSRRLRRPRLLLHGHIHESFGVQSYAGTLVSNAATVQHKIVIGCE